MWDEGAEEYAHDMWNILDFVTNSLYIATLTLRVIAFLQVSKKTEPGHEKMCLMSYAKNEGADQTARMRSLISAFVVRCLDSIAKISRL